MFLSKTLSEIFGSQTPGISIFKHERFTTVPERLSSQPVENITIE